MLNGYKQLYFALLRMKCPAEDTGAERGHFTGSQTWVNQGYFGLVRPPRQPKGSGLWHAGTRVDDHRVVLTSGITVAVRQAAVEDLPAIVRVHLKAFSHFFLTRLGSEFLHRYYDLVLHYRAGILLVSEWQGALNGFACGFLNPAEFYGLMWRNGWTFVRPALSALVRHPYLATGVMRGVQKIQTSASRAAVGSCELSSIAVAPEAGGSRLGRTLVEAFLAQAWSMDAQCIYLTTDADGNEPANALYQKSGFQRVRRFLQCKGRWMNEYVIDRSGTGGGWGARI
ncbi:MAG TPA: GNAT family N-acetyltransferase [Candidatus Solibacter sp.]|nr:GNAT family N-acetyltransferase [Candidatus Solibacter sp.]